MNSLKELPIRLKIQLVLFLITFVLFIFSLFFIGLDGFVLVFAALTLVVMGYNNFKLRNNKMLAILYLLFGAIMFIQGIMRIING